MILNPRIALILLLLFTSALRTQPVSKAVFELFPKERLLNPLRAFSVEPRLGILYFPVDGTLKVDIGNSIDLLKIISPDSANRFVLGVDFMAYANAINYHDFRLQISALDGFFGGHLLYSPNEAHPGYFLRLRYIHNSAHLGDAKYDLYTDSWVNNFKPFPFARDFVEVVYITRVCISSLIIEPYAGLFYSVLVRPNSLKRVNALAGIELHTDNSGYDLLQNPFNYFFACLTQLNGMPKYQLTHELQAGIKLGRWLHKGLVLYVSYYYGNNVFNIFYMERISRAGLGFTVDFP